MKHPSEQDLALYAGGDLGRVQRWTIGRHIRGCSTCRDEVLGFTDAGAVLDSESAALPPTVDWDRLSAEMSANIRLGLAAGRIVATPARTDNRLSWRPAAVLASATALLVTAWWLNVPRNRRVAGAIPQQVVQSVPMVRSTEAGIEVKGANGTLTLLRPSTASTALEVSAPGSLRERFVDGDTGQVTINNVYAE